LPALRGRAARGLAAAALLLLLAVPAVAQAPGVEGKWWKRPRIAAALQLSADQVDQLEKIFARVKPRLIDLRADLQKKQFAYDQAMTSDKPVDRKEVESMIEAREAARSALQKELALMELDMKQVLHPDQRERLVRMRENARQMTQERRRRIRDAAPSDDELLDAPAPTPARTPKPR
jgi:Spy/CpxP family protein refolding chaperone